MSYITNCKILRRVAAFALCAVLALCAAGCGGKSKTVLRVGVMPDLDSIPLMAAKQAGYLPDDIVLEVYKSPVERDSALYSGHLDGSVSDLLAAFLAAGNSQGYKALTVTDGCYRLVAGGKAGVTSIGELQGKTVGMSVHTIIEYAADRLLQAGGLSPDQVEKTAVPSIPARLELLQSGQLDAAVLPEPYATAAIEGGGVLLGSSTDLHMDAGLLLFSDEAFTDKAALMQKLLTGYDKAAADLNAGKANLKKAADALGLPATVDASLLPVYRPSCLPGTADAAAAAKWLTDNSLLETALDPSVVMGCLTGTASHG